MWLTRPCNSTWFLVKKKNICKVFPSSHANHLYWVTGPFSALHRFLIFFPPGFKGGMDAERSPSAATGAQRCDPGAWELKPTQNAKVPRELLHSHPPSELAGALKPKTSNITIINWNIVVYCKSFLKGLCLKVFKRSYDMTWQHPAITSWATVPFGCPGNVWPGRGTCSVPSESLGRPRSLHTSGAPSVSVLVIFFGKEAGFHDVSRFHQ